MQIIISSPYKIANHGAILQAWALRIVLERMGHDVRHLNCDWMWRGYSHVGRLVLSRSISHFLIKLRANRMMTKSFVEMGNVPETRKYRNLRDLLVDPPSADCYLAGSDQIFGLNYFCDRNRYLPVLLGFGSPGTKRIAYGASFGTNCAKDYIPYRSVAEGLNRFSAIGIRERSGLDILKEWAGKEGVWTPDPTFLLSAEEYRRAFRVKQMPSGCVCSYLLGWGGREQISDTICGQIAKRFGLSERVYKLGSPLSVGEWLSGIDNSSCVVTNSFHGLCFALIFNKPFVVLGFDGCDAWRNERHADLLRSVGCRDVKIITSLGDFADGCEVSHAPSRGILEELKASGMNFIRTWL